jgi:hypothetical protein
VTPPVGRHSLPRAVGLAAAIGGAIAAIHYHQLGLTLTHYDARGHLIVARRIFDSLTPGWQQIGAVWLPLPHLLNAIPAQLDLFYRTGAAAVAMSVAAFGLACGAIAWILLMVTDSAAASVVGAAVFALNPNVVYLQATPMTEPLLLALTTTAVALLVEWCRPADMGFVDGASDRKPRQRTARSVGVMFALACLTRYEAWPVTVSALAAAVWALRRQGKEWRTSLDRVASIAKFPAAGIVAFVMFSRVVIGRWFVGDFFVPENVALGHPSEALDQVVWGVVTLSSYALSSVAAAGLGLLLVWGLADRTRTDRLIALSLTTTAALPLSAFVDGHPFRIRYMVPLVVAQAIGAGVLVGAFGRSRLVWVPAALLLGLAVFELHPLDRSAPMVVEAQWDRPNVSARQGVTHCLSDGYHGDTIMASMGSLGHYMQDLIRAGFNVRDFLHEGNGDIWLAALDHPRPYAGWILVEEKAQGGDMLAKIARARPEFLDGYSRVCEAAGVALYRRTAVPPMLRAGR